jgi:ATP-dependent helicase HrpA
MQAAIATRGAQLHPDIFDAAQLQRLPDHLRVTFSVEETAKDTAHGTHGRHSKQHRIGRGGTKAQINVLGTSKSLLELQNQLENRAVAAARTSVSKKAKAAKDSGNPLQSATLLHQAGATSKPREEMLWQVAYDRLKLPAARISSRWLSREALVLASAPYKNREALVADLQMAAVKRLMPAIAQLHDDADLEQTISLNEEAFEDTVYAVARDVITALRKFGEVQNEVSGTAQLPLLAVLQSIRDHLADLVYPGFIAATPPDALPELPRYITADEVRLRKAKADKTRDVKWAWEAHEAQGVVDDARHRLDALPAGPAHDALRSTVSQMRWMYEEFLVSLWAQELGTKYPASLQRLKKLAAE